jgi:hypothetical protein
VKIIGVSIDWIAGFMVGVEFAQDEECKMIECDLGIIRVIIYWGSQ